MNILVFNCGSSSLKFELIEIRSPGDNNRRFARGTFEQIGGQTRLTIAGEAGNRSEQISTIADHAAAAVGAIDWLRQTSTLTVDAVAHRVVHGGERIVEPSVATAEVMHALELASRFAPLHNPPAISTIRAVGEKLPGIPAVVVTDTGFHRTLPRYAHGYAIPRGLAERHGIRRFGFHGIGHAWMVERCALKLARAEDKLNLITLHLGAGCSAAAIREGCSVDTSMGLTPLEGLMMATRSGDIDPGIFTFLAASENLQPPDVERILNHESGLLGVSGISKDLRDIERAAEHDRHAAEAIEMFCYRVRKYIGSYLAVLGHTDAIVFGGGIGEHSALVRERACAGLERLGIIIDTPRNRHPISQETRISVDNSAVQVWIIPLDEELYIARAAAQLLAKNVHSLRPG
jgi:acetate kinase